MHTILNRAVVNVAQSHNAKWAQVQLDELLHPIDSIFLKERHRMQLLFRYYNESMLIDPHRCYHSNKQS